MGASKYVLGEIRKITLIEKKSDCNYFFLVSNIKYKDVKMNIRWEPVSMF